MDDSLYPRVVRMVGRVRVRIGETEVELEGEEAFVEKHLKEVLAYLDRSGRAGRDLPAKIIQAAETEARSKPTREPSPAEYYRQTNASTGTETLIVLAKYMEDYRGKSEFTPADLNKIAGEAKLADIHSQYVTYAMKQGFLRQVSKGKYALTLSGEDAVLGLAKKAAA